jgi:type II restriction enzyme
MTLANKQKAEIKQVIAACLRSKFQNYTPESTSMPFHHRLLGKDRMALYSFIHSLSTKFGTSIFEPVAKSLATLQHKEALLQQIAGNKIASGAQIVIQNIIDNLSTAKSYPNKTEEIKAIRDACRKGSVRTVKPTRIDLKIIGNDDTIYLIDIKTAKPNAGGFMEFKRTLLEWVAVTLAINPTAEIRTLIAIPYNPYEPKQYNRWTMRGMLDIEQELFVANEFWDFLGGENAYTDVLGCFEETGIELRSEIDEYFKKFNRQEM